MFAVQKSPAPAANSGNQLQNIDHADDGAMQATASTSIAAVAALRKPRKIPGKVESPIRRLDIRDVQACGENMLAVAMLSDIRFWLEPDGQQAKLKKAIEKDGYRWVARSIAGWKQHFNIKSDQMVRTAVKYLRASEEVEVSDFWFSGNLTPHYRLKTEGVENDVEGEGVENGMGGVDFNRGGVENNKTITESYSETVVKENLNINNAHENPCAQEAQATPTPDSTTGKINPWNQPLEQPQDQNLESTPPPSPGCAAPPSPASAKTSRASESFVRAYTAQKAAYNQVSKSDGVSLDVTEAEASALQRVEYRAGQAGLNPVEFIEWLTPKTFQRLGFDHDDDPRYGVLWLTSERLTTALDRYRAELDAAEQQRVREAERTATRIKEFERMDERRAARLAELEAERQAKAA